MSEIVEGQPIRELDPFTFFDGYASAIKPLGGTQRGPDPTYGFHSQYFEYRPGPLVFTVRFEGLQASFGELSIHINGYVPGSGNHAVLVTAERHALADLIAGSSEFTVRVNAVEGVSYAIFGFLPGGTDATATAVAISVQELGFVESAAVPAEAFEPTRFGDEPLDRPARLVVNDPPSFRDPVSQPLTAGQLDEPEWRQRTAKLPASFETPADRWSVGFVLQALDRYGLSRPGARGLSLGDAGSPIAATLAAQGCSILFGLDGQGDDPSPTLQPARYPGLCPDATFDAQCQVRPMMLVDLPDDLRGFDFLWSLGAVNRLGSVTLAAHFLDVSLRSLRPGGFAVHVFDMVTPGTPLAFGRATPQPLHRKRIERIALTLISHRNEVAQLNFGGECELIGHRQTIVEDGQSLTVEVVPFGLIARRN